MSRRKFWLALGEKVEGKDTVRWTDRELGPQSISYAAVKLYHYDRDPSVAYLVRVADVFRVRLRWLTTGAGPMDRTAAHIAADLEAAEAESEAARLARADEELSDAVDAVVARAFEEEDRRQRAEKGVTDAAVLRSDAVRAVFASAWRRLGDTCPDRNLSPEDLNAVGMDLLSLVTAPLLRWGFIHEDSFPEPQALENYMLAMLHALMLGMAPPGRGEPIAALRKSAPSHRKRTHRATGRD